MAYQETHTTSYGSRLSNSFKKIGTGLAMFIGATVLLFWNEGRAVKTAETIKEAQVCMSTMCQKSRLTLTDN